MISNVNSSLFEKLRRDYPVFTYESFTILAEDDVLHLSFDFNINEDIRFQPKISLHTGQSAQELNGKLQKQGELISNIVFHIGMIELISYWKCVCSPQILIRAGSISPEQLNWFRNLYYNGLGEFLYTNGIAVNIEDFVSMTATGTQTFSPASLTTENKFIVPVGGGKDSAVTLDLLSGNGFKIKPLIMNPRGATIKTVEAAGMNVDEILTIRRSIDPALLRLNEQGFLNGHTPFSAMLAFYTLLMAALTGYRNIALSNESSANEPTIPGTTINHQYSKTFEFEADFREYYAKYITPDLNYFSFLRPLNELQIMQLFSGMKKFHAVFRSCNVGSKTDEWCGACSKCMFTHIMLSAFVGTEQANKLIGAEMLELPEMKHVFDELTGIAPNKPFECVGTLDDVNQAITRIIDQHQELPFLLQHYQQHKKHNSVNLDVNTLNPHHFVPEELIAILKKALQ